MVLKHERLTNGSRSKIYKHALLLLYFILISFLRIICHYYVHARFI